ncbi:MAG TPA: hypothetical protein VFI97_09900 [Arthrobacter sp.]|nr:hypothetical protein [Arthrobacter sp.]
MPGSAAHAVSDDEWSKAAGLNGTNYFIGQYRNADGQTAYCTDFEKLAPRYAEDYDDGHSGAFVRSDGHALNTNENAALSYLLNRWGATSKKETAAAVQLSVWAMTSPGMAWGSAKMKELIGQEDLPAGIVKKAKSMTRTAGENAGPYSIRIILGDASDAGLISKAAVAVHGADGSRVEGLKVKATVDGGFAFANGKSTIRWTSGTGQHMLQLDRTTLGAGELRITVPETPAAGVHWLEPDHGHAQRLLTASVLESREAASKLAALPAFQPKVITETSAATTEPGSQLHDVLKLSVAETGQDSLGRWLHHPDTGDPLSVEVTSTLWGPLDQKPELSNTIPDGIPKVGTVITRVDGPGTYKTPSLTVTGAGFYVWTETINPASTRPVQAAQFVEPWKSKFGIIKETTLVPWKLNVRTELSQHEAVIGDSVTDLVTVSGFPESAPAGDSSKIRLTMYGPLERKPNERVDAPDEASVFAQVLIPAANGQYRSSSFGTFTEPGCYTVMASYAGDERALPYTSAYGIPEETVCVSPKPPSGQEADSSDEPTAAAGPPSAPNPSALKPSTPTSSAPKPSTQRVSISAASADEPDAARPHLAETGASLDLMAAGGITATGLGLACGALSWRRRP